MVTTRPGNLPRMTQESLFDGDGSAAPLVPPHPTLEKLRGAAAPARLARSGRPARRRSSVRGGGRELMFVGEQPGDREDIEGRPFVGPAGQLFDKALEDAGIDRSRTYVTNVVKHFKWTPRGKRRIHRSRAGWRSCVPSVARGGARGREAARARAVGAMAAQALLGRSSGSPASAADRSTGSRSSTCISDDPPERDHLA